MTEIDDLRVTVEKLEAEVERNKDRLGDEILIVDRVWAALGIGNYEQAAGKAIFEIVADWKARAESAEQSLATLQRDYEALRGALEPFARFFKSEKHDLRVASDTTIVATFLDQDTKEPLAELYISDFRAAHEALSKPVPAVDAGEKTFAKARAIVQEWEDSQRKIGNQGYAGLCHELGRALDRVSSAPSTSQAVVDHICHACKGEGFVKAWHEVAGDQNVKCGRCNGTGRILYRPLMAGDTSEAVVAAAVQVVRDDCDGVIHPNCWERLRTAVRNHIEKGG